MYASRKIAILAVLISFACVRWASAQKQLTAADAKIVGGGTVAQEEQEEPDVKAGAPSVESAWSLLTAAARKGVQPRVVTLAALGSMGLNPRAAKMIRDGLSDPDLDVRIAAVLAAGQTKNRALLPALRERLSDSEPQVVFASAVTLWKLKDRSGEDVLKQVMAGDRSAKPGLMHGARNNMSHELHDPAALATIGATEGASMLLGPFGFGLTAFNYMRKSGANPARAQAINLLAESRVPGIRDELFSALHDKDASVRAAAARALGQLRDPHAVKPLGELFTDGRLPVRLTAAAAYINCSRRGPRRA